MERIKESEIEAWMKARIEKMNGMFMKFVSPGNDGVPDRIAFFPDSRAVFIELKARRGKLSELQKYQLKRLLKMHQQVAVVYGPDGADTFIQDMKDHVVSSAAYLNDLGVERLEDWLG